MSSKAAVQSETWVAVAGTVLGFFAYRPEMV